MSTCIQVWPSTSSGGGQQKTFVACTSLQQDVNDDVGDMPSNVKPIDMASQTKHKGKVLVLYLYQEMCNAD